MKLDQIADEGLVKQMELFDLWDLEKANKVDPNERWADEPRIVRCRLRTHPDITLNLYYRPRPLPPNTARQFAAALSKPPHALSETGIDDISLVFRDAAYPEYFNMRSARTEILRGRTVLVYDGVWLSTNLRNLGIFFAADELAFFVQEIHYLAPADIFEAHLGEAKMCLDSIDWNEPARR
jgi:hypothetical protein